MSGWGTLGQGCHCGVGRIIWSSHSDFGRPLEPLSHLSMQRSDACDQWVSHSVFDGIRGQEYHVFTPFTVMFHTSYQRSHLPGASSAFTFQVDPWVDPLATRQTRAHIRDRPCLGPPTGTRAWMHGTGAAVRTHTAAFR